MQMEENKNITNATIKELFKDRKWKNLFSQTDISSLVFFRILFGLLMFFEVTRYLDTQHNWIAKYWLEPKYHFTYYPFDFLTPLPGNGMYLLFYFMGFLAICIVAGFLYRLTTCLFWLCFSYTFLLEQTRYMNHFYLVVLISFVMIFIPAHRSLSLDSFLFKKIKSETVPVWSLWLARFMVGVPYFFGGIAKINADWLQGQPLKIWLANKTDFPVIGHLFHYDWMALFMAYSGLFLDVLIVPALLFKKTRRWGFILIVSFHLMNSKLFNIGIFPWFMIAATSLYFEPDWFRKFVNLLTGNKWKITYSANEISANDTELNRSQKITLAALCFWVAVQVLLPIRHFFIPGVVHWTEEGHRYSWHMKLRTKSSKGVYTVRDKKTGLLQIVNQSDYLTNRQMNKISDRPYLVWQFCQMIKKDYRQRGMDVAVYANVKSSLNGRKYQQLIDSTVDLASVPRPVFPVSWIVPLHTPLSDQLDPDEDADDGGE